MDRRDEQLHGDNTQESTVVSLRAVLGGSRGLGDQSHSLQSFGGGGGPCAGMRSWRAMEMNEGYVLCLFTIPM
jgi:hypothetical protein